MGFHGHSLHAGYHGQHSQKSCTVSGSESRALKREFSNWDLSFLDCLYIFPAVLSVITRNTADQSFWESKMAAKKCFVDFAFSAAPDSTHRGSKIPIFRLKKALP